MTATVVEREDDGVNPTAGPIVLALSCSQVQQYLQADNIPLRRWINPPLIRVDVHHIAAGIQAYFEIPNKPEHLVTIAQHHKHMSWAELEEKIKNQSWLAERLAAVIMANMRAELHTDVDPDRVEEVFIADHLVDNGGYTLRSTLQLTFKNAWFFNAHNSRGSLPERIWDEDVPLCMNCGTKMRPAGSAFVCEGCGATSGFSTRVAQDNDVLCEGCSYPMEEVVDRRRLGSRTYHCCRCGHEQSI